VTTPVDAVAADRGGSPAASRAVGAARFVAGVVLLAANGALAQSAFEAIASDSRGGIHYVLVSPSLVALEGWILASAVALLALQLVATGGVGRYQRLITEQTTRHLKPLGWLTLSLAPLLALFVPHADRLAPLWYVLFDLRWYWWPLVAWDVIRCADVSVVRWHTLTPALALAAVVLVPLALDVASAPNLRFNGTLHGDEPKYLRFCENFYQGEGFDISQIRRLVDASGSDFPRIAHNVTLMTTTVPDELVLLAHDIERSVRARRWRPTLSGGEPTPGMFFEGKHRGTVYQLHNPGVAFLLFPAYAIDRLVTGSGVGYADEFPAEMPAVNAALLALAAAYAVSLYLLLLAYSGSRPRALLLALLGTVTLPVSAFTFQIYPEVPAGIAVFLVVRAIMTRTPSSAWGGAVYGLLAGFLPWLHVRFGLATVVLLLSLLAALRATRRAQAGVVIGAAIPLLLLSLYTYRLTGSLIPVATYGSDAPLSLMRMLRGIPGFALDRVWGLLPHAPVYLLALPGIALAWRRSPWMTLLIGLVVVTVALPAAGHGYWAGGSTPGRYLVAVVPLLLLFLSDAMARWGSRRTFLSALLVLTAVSVETAIRYNLSHVKEVGPIVAREFAGWRLNVLFPSMGTDAWSATPADVLLLCVWVAALVALIAAGWTLGGRRPREPLNRSSASLMPTLWAGLLVMTAVGVVAAAGSEPYNRDYLVPAQQAREEALRAFAGLEHCVACYSSRSGAVAPTIALGNDAGFVDLRQLDDSAVAGAAARIRIRPRTATGEFLVSTVRIEFGDGQVSSYRRSFGDIDDTHIYRIAGDYEIHAWVTGAPGSHADAAITLHVSER
jgi:hypothetical protein